MGTDFLSHLQTLPPARLQPIVRQALGAADAEPLDWHCRLLGGGAERFGRGGEGLFRFAGTTKSAGVTQSWSAVLKVAGGSGPLASDDPTHPEYWKREADAYQSGCLIDLPPGLTAPRCFGVEQESEREVWIWLEDIVEQASGWTLERYELTARRLGQFNGAYLVGHSLPPGANWLLNSGRAPGWIGMTESLLDNLYPFMETPQGQRWFQPGSQDRIARLYANRQALLHSLEQLPRCFCHHDAFQRNLLERPTADGRIETVAIDWSYCGYGGVGQEIAAMIAVALLFLDVSANQAQALEEAVFTGYLAGFRDVGWQGDPRLVRLGYSATVGLAWGVTYSAVISIVFNNAEGTAIQEQITGHSVDEIMSQTRDVQPMFYSLGEEALALAETI